MNEFNGKVSIYPTLWCNAAEKYIATDAGQNGYGAVFANEWFDGKWTADEEKQSQRVVVTVCHGKNYIHLCVQLLRGENNGK